MALLSLVNKADRSLPCRARGRPGSSLLSARRSISPRPGQGSSQLARHRDYSVDPALGARPEQMGTLFEFKFVAVKENQLTPADRRTGIRPTSSSHTSTPVMTRIDLQNLDIVRFKALMAQLAEEQHPGCKDLFQEADLKGSGSIQYFGYITNNGRFPKGNLQQIGAASDFEEFKGQVKDWVGKRMGVQAIMIDPHARPKSKRGNQASTCTALRTLCLILADQALRPPRRTASIEPCLQTTLTPIQQGPESLL